MISFSTILAFCASLLALQSPTKELSWETRLKAHSESVCIDPQNSETLFAGSRNKLYHSRDKGRTWKLIQSFHPSALIKQIAIPVPHSIVVTVSGVDNGGIYFSNDSGKNFQRTWCGRVYGRSLTSLEGKLYFFSTPDKAIFQSIDHGLTWSQWSVAIPDTLPGYGCSLLRVDPSTFLVSTSSAQIWYFAKGKWATTLDLKANNQREIPQLARWDAKVLAISTGGQRDSPSIWQSNDTGRSWVGVKGPMHLWSVVALDQKFLVGQFYDLDPSFIQSSVYEYVEDGAHSFPVGNLKDPMIWDLQVSADHSYLVAAGSNGLHFLNLR